MGSEKRKKHIVMYIGSLCKGGAERVMSNLAEYFFSEGYKVTFVTTYVEDDEYDLPHAAWKVVPEGGNVTAISPRGQKRCLEVRDDDESIGRVFSALTSEESSGRIANVFKRVSKLRRIFKEQNPDIILSFLGKNNIMAICAGKKLGIPVVVSVRSNPSREYKGRGLKLGMKYFFPKAAGVVVQTTGARDYFNESIRKKCRILPNSIHPDFINGDVVPMKDRKKQIVSVGRLDENKNQILLINAFEEISKKYPDYELVIYGDGPSRKSFEKRAEEINANITFMGNVSGVSEYIKNAKVFVLTSKQEGMPNALIEAMSMGLACISTNCPCGGPFDIIKNGENGQLIEMGTDDEMKASLVKALDKYLSDEALMEKVSEEAVKVREDYSPGRINSMWKEYLDGLMK